ncbi:hypothetical protein SCX97_10935 [Parabacteroides distasonis]|uniref:hypothetical protein n=1 Tax=Parabacteroides distasonis TaxID=823 RepID=UPI00298E6588|nr:hypothetical protein [Parabacteroides distasonis]MDW7574035.1 hypothetical protein [Parabacteroides distasonis]
MNKLIKVILFLIVGMVQVFAWGGLREDTLAKELDEAVLNRSFYLQQREQRITQLKDMFLLSKISLWQEYEINHQLYEEFKKIQQDSAIYYIKRNMEIASFMKDTVRIYTSRLRLATLYAFSGMYRELLSKEQKQDFYEAYYSFFSYYSTNLDSFEYRKQLDLYKDSLLSVLDTASYRYKINLAQKYLAHGQARSAEKVPLLAIYSSA